MGSELTDMLVGETWDYNGQCSGIISSVLALIRERSLKVGNCQEWTREENRKCPLAQRKSLWCVCARALDRAAEVEKPQRRVTGRMGQLSGGVTYPASPEPSIHPGKETSREMGQGAADSPLVWRGGWEMEMIA